MDDAQVYVHLRESHAVPKVSRRGRESIEVIHSEMAPSKPLAAYGH